MSRLGSTWLAALGLITLLMACTVVPARSQCASLGICADSASYNRGVQPYSRAPWYLWTPPNVPFIQISDNAYRTMVQKVLDRYGNIDPAVPYDYQSTDPTRPKTWSWATASDLLDLTERRSGITSAGTIDSYGGPSYPCLIVEADIYFAYNPQDDIRMYCWTDEWCAPSCFNAQCGEMNLDFLACAMHEFGHALGLAHSWYYGATMSPAMSIQDTTARYLLACELDYLKTKYRDNIGPSLVDSFAVRTRGDQSVTCTWSTQLESRCHKYRLTRVCEDGVRTVLADSLPCMGVGVSQTIVDGSPCAGQGKYVLAVVESLNATTWRDVVLAEGAAGGAGQQGARAGWTRGEKAWRKSDASGPADAVRLLGVAVTDRDMLGARQVLADGFQYVTRDGQFWGRSIDGILERRMLECLASADTTIDSLVFVPDSVRYVDETVARVTANAFYTHRCQGFGSEWNGRIVALVERRRQEDGWRIREVTELW